MEFEVEDKGLVVAEGNYSVCYGGREKSCRCRVTFDLTRDQHFQIDCLESVHELGIEPIPKGSFFIRVSPAARPIECHTIRLRQQVIGDNAYAHVMLCPISGKHAVDHGSRIVRLNAGIANFYEYWIHGPRGLSFSLQGGEWNFEFTPVGDKTLMYPRQIQNDSYSFSHHLELRRADSAVFSSTEALKAIENLSTFLSFCAEHWVSPVLIVGFDESGTVAIEDWGTRKIAPRQEPSNWLDRHNGSAMAEVFPGFWGLAEDPAWRDALRTAVYWYVRADTNHVGPDGAIILIQAALERLAWHVLVQQRRAVSQVGFSKKLPTADRIRLLLDSCAIPLNFPVELADLANSAPQQGWRDGPEAFVQVRNQLVHPQERRKLMFRHAYYEALQLGKWYLELVLLRSCGFNGQYSRRLKIPRWAGEVETVPWARVGS